MLTLFFYLSAPPIPTVLWIISSSPRAYLLLTHPLSPIYSASLSLFAPFFFPPSRPVAERLSTWTTPPPAGCNRSYSPPPLPGVPNEFLMQSCACLPLSGCPSFSDLDLRLDICLSQSSLVRVSLPPYTQLPQPHAPPSCRPQPETQSPVSPELRLRVLLPQSHSRGVASWVWKRTRRPQIGSLWIRCSKSDQQTTTHGFVPY